jgi:hypothetical protein
MRFGRSRYIPVIWTEKRVAHSRRTSLNLVKNTISYIYIGETTAKKASFSNEAS